jgi:hypothetical protein
MTSSASKAMAMALEDDVPKISSSSQTVALEDGASKINWRVVYRRAELYDRLLAKQCAVFDRVNSMNAGRLDTPGAIEHMPKPRGPFLCTSQAVFLLIDATIDELRLFSDPLSNYAKPMIEWRIIGPLMGYHLARIFKQRLYERQDPHPVVEWCCVYLARDPTMAADWRRLPLTYRFHALDRKRKLDELHHDALAML